MEHIEIEYNRNLKPLEALLSLERWGRGTQKIVELCVQAGHPEPEFVEQAGALGVRFLPTAYIAPHRVGHDLTSRQRRILQALAGRQDVTFGELRSLTGPTVAIRSFRDDLLHLKRLRMIGLRGRGRGATWFIVRTDGNNRAEQGGMRRVPPYSHLIPPVLPVVDAFRALSKTKFWRSKIG